MTIALRALNGCDVAQAYVWRNDPNIRKWCRQHDVISHKQHLAWFDRQDADPTIKMYAITHQSGLVGVCGLTSIDYINRKAEFSLYIGTEFQRRGFATEALELLIDVGFGAYNLHSIYGEAFAENPAIKMFEKIGFTRSGKNRDAYFRDGRYIDAYIFSILSDDWSGRYA